MTIYNNGKFGLSLINADLNPDRPRSHWISQRIQQLKSELKEQEEILQVSNTKESLELLANYHNEIQGYTDYLLNN